MVPCDLQSPVSMAQLRRRLRHRDGCSHPRHRHRSLLEGGIRGAIRLSAWPAPTSSSPPTRTFTRPMVAARTARPSPAPSSNAYGSPQTLPQEVSARPWCGRRGRRRLLPGVPRGHGEQVARTGRNAVPGPCLDDAVRRAVPTRPGRGPEGASEVVIDSGLARRTGLKVGDRTPAVVAGRTVEATVSGIAGCKEAGSLTEQSAVFFSDESAHEPLRAPRPGRPAA